MTVNYKDWNLTNLGQLVILGIVFTLIIAAMHFFVSPLLVMVLPTVFTTGLSLTEVLLFLILITLYIRK